MRDIRLLGVCLVVATIRCTYGDGDYRNWKYHFPNGSAMGLFLAVALPLQLPNKSAYLAYNFEANFNLPGNETEVEYPPVIERKAKFQGFGRKMVYDIIEAKMKSHGLNGKNCLLRTICEASLHTFNNNGILGDLFHILLTPSTSKNDFDLSDDYNHAERAGRAKNCKMYFKKCKRSIISLISWVGHIL